ncbi:MAG: uncharacterized protein QOD00_1067 [Blastocatellia bacterium]|nr:uncharacterized protein [Blastocatellia bacterium]
MSRRLCEGARPMSRIIVESCVTQMPDGVGLLADLTLADDRRAHPALLVRTPYGRAEAMAQVDAVELARAGWAVVVQSVRGRGGSGGVFNPFLQEGDDGDATIRWCCQQPWSDGRVAMSGASYAGITQWKCALAKPKGLKAISPQITASDVGEDWFYEGGAFRHAFIQSWGVSFAFTDETNREAQTLARRIAADLAGLYRSAPARSPLAEIFPPYLRWREPTDKALWDECRGLHRREPPDIPAFHLAGWYDIFCEGGLRDYASMREGAPSDYARARQRLLIGPWTHTALFSQQAGEWDHGLQANGYVLDVMGEMHGWLRRVLDDEEVEGGARVFVLGSDEWLELKTWPPPRADLRRLYLDAERGANGLQGDGRLRWSPAEKAGSDSFRYDPANPVPTRGGRNLDPTLPGPGPLDQQQLEQRADLLVYTSDVMEEELCVMGIVRAEIIFETSGRSADVVVKLVDVHPDGRALQVLCSALRTEFTAHDPQLVRVNVGNIAITFRRGHRVRVEIASSNFPHLDLNPSTGQASTRALDFEAADQKVYRGARSPSFIELPVVDPQRI